MSTYALPDGWAQSLKRSIHALAATHKLPLSTVHKLWFTLLSEKISCRGADASTLQTALKEQLAREPGAVPAFVAGLRHYLHQPLRLKRLLQPCIGPEQPASAYQTGSQSPSDPAAVQQTQADACLAKQHDARNAANDQGAQSSTVDADPSAGKAVETGDSAAPSMVAGSTLPARGPPADPAAAASAPLGPGNNSDAPCLLSVLTGIVPLRPALVDLLMDTMVAACQHGRGGDRGSASVAGAGSAAEPSLASAVAAGEHTVKCEAASDQAACAAQAAQMQ